MSDVFKQFTMGGDPPEELAPRRELHIELVPRTAWGVNLRSALSKAGWDKLRKATYRKAGYVCEICGGKGPRHPVECHEIWEYEDIKGRRGDQGVPIQRLVGLVALCPACHEVKHFGRATVTGKRDRAFRHLMRVNGWDPGQARRHVREAKDLWDARSYWRWELDLSWLETQGVAIPEQGREPEIDDDFWGGFHPTDF